MAAGRPLVASRAGGLPELVRPGETGLLVPERDVKALAEAIETLARDAELRERMGAAAQRLIREELTWDAVAGRFESGFERAVAGRSPSERTGVSRHTPQTWRRASHISPSVT